jgi:glycerol uptake facilitator-like aquaporin
MPLAKRAIAEFIGTFWLVFGAAVALFSPPPFQMSASGTWA